MNEFIGCLLTLLIICGGVFILYWGINILIWLLPLLITIGVAVAVIYSIAYIIGRGFRDGKK